MSDESTTKVEFEIGVAQDPKAINALASLARAVADAQAKMLEGVRAIEQAASSAEAAVSRVAKSTKQVGSAASGGMPGSYTASFPATVPNVSVPTAGPPQTTRLPPPYAVSPPLTAPASGRGTSSLPAPFATVPASPPRLPPNNPPPTAAPPSPQPTDQTTPQPVADLPGHIDLLAKSSEKAFKGIVDVVRGFTLLGLVSEESSEQLLKGLVATEGVVSILKGAADIIDAGANISTLRAASKGGGVGAAAAAAAGGGGAAAAGGSGFMATTFMGVNVGTGGAVGIGVPCHRRRHGGREGR